MNQIRLFAVGTVMIFALTAAAQQSSATSSSATTQNHNSTQSSADPVEHHLQVLSDKLNLSAEQEDRVRPILQEMHDSWGKAEQNQSLSDEQRNAQKHAAFMKADGQIRDILSEDQKKMLDQLEQEMHPESHGK
jgi:TolA-binding protein